MSSGVKKPETEERKFAMITSETISLFAESQGHILSKDVARVLSEDANYRLRDIVSEASQYMKHGRRSRLTVDDIKHAASDMNLDRIIGSGFDSVTKYTRVPEVNLHYAVDKLVDLTELISKEIKYGLCKPLALTEEWISPALQASPNSTLPTSSPFLSTYFTAITDAASGADAQLKQVALADVLSNPRISLIQCQLLEFARRWSQCSAKSGTVSRQLLELLDAVTSNPYIMLGKQPINELLQILLSDVCLSDVCCNSGSEQQYAAYILAKMMRWPHMSPDALSSIVNKCTSVLLDATSSPVVAKGAVMVINALGAKYIEQVVTDEVISTWLPGGSETPLPLQEVQSYLVDSIGALFRQFIAHPHSQVRQNTITSESTWRLVHTMQEHFPNEVCYRLYQICNTQSSVFKVQRLRHSHSGKFGVKVKHSLADYFDQTFVSPKAINIRYGIMRPCKPIITRSDKTRCESTTSLRGAKSIELYKTYFNRRQERLSNALPVGKANPLLWAL